MRSVRTSSRPPIASPRGWGSAGTTSSGERCTEPAQGRSSGACRLFCSTSPPPDHACGQFDRSSARLCSTPVAPQPRDFARRACPQCRPHSLRARACRARPDKSSLDNSQEHRKRSRSQSCRTCRGGGGCSAAGPFAVAPWRLASSSPARGLALPSLEIRSQKCASLAARPLVLSPTCTGWPSRRQPRFRPSARPARSGSARGSTATCTSITK
jgi:hypothetical protein